jgi:hypothetical protein
MHHSRAELFIQPRGLILSCTVKKCLVSLLLPF